MPSIVRSLPEWSKVLGRSVLSSLNTILYFGEERFCPLCEKKSSKFQSYGTIPRTDAKCPHCGSLERDRLVWIYINSKTKLFKDSSRKALHIAPEQCLERRFRTKLGDRYTTADISHNRADIKLDIIDIPFPNQSFDAIYCSHVLEHVPDDIKALQELYRVLSNTGWAILNVPIQGDKTFEDPTITDPKKRLQVFGQEDHVRIYGSDYIDRLRKAGFHVEVFQVDDFVDSEQATKMGLNSEDNNIYFCRK